MLWKNKSHLIPPESQEQSRPRRKEQEARVVGKVLKKVEISI